MKKGFTLIELLGTILILSAIVLIVAPLIINKVKDSKVKLEGTSEENIVLSAKNWAMDNKDKLPINGEDLSISLDILQEDGYLANKKQEFNGCVVINNKQDIYYYKYSDNLEECQNIALLKLTYDAQDGILANGNKKETIYTKYGNNADLTKKADKRLYNHLGWNTKKTASEGLKTFKMEKNSILYAIYKPKDTTPPELSISTSSTTNSITVVAKATDKESAIDKYRFRIDGGKWQTVSAVGTSATYVFTGLKHNQTYDIDVEAINECELSTTKSTSPKTKLLNPPTFSETVGTTNVVTITYQEGNNLIYEYKKNSNNWQDAVQKQKVSFTDNGTLVARVSDGTNEASSTFTVRIKINASYTAPVYYCPSGYSQSGSGSSMVCSKTISTSASKKCKSVSVSTKNLLYVAGHNECDNNGNVAAYTDNQDLLISRGYNCSFSGCNSSCKSNPGGVVYCTASCQKGGIINNTYSSTLSGGQCVTTAKVQGTNICNGTGDAVGYSDMQSYYKNKGFTCDQSTYYCTNSCPGKSRGYTYYCYITCTRRVSASGSNISYTCPSGYSLSGSTCRKTDVRGPNKISGYYTCPSGYTLSGSLCYKN